MHLEPLPRTLLLDIEGTVGDAAFVRDVMFPHARARLREYLRANVEIHEIAQIMIDVRAAAALSDSASVDEVASALEAWSDADRKITPLKTLQGLIWESGFADGTLVAHLYPDAVSALQRWDLEGRRLAIYSSGSVRAQQLYFGHSVAGDLRSRISAWFDTTTGQKTVAASYVAIARGLDVSPGELFFFTDAPAEIAAATQAGVRTGRIDRTRAPNFVDLEGATIVAGSFAPWIA